MGIAADQDSMVLLHMLLEVEMVLVSILTMLTLIRSDVLVRVHVAFIAGEVGEALLTKVTLIQFLIILHVSALNVFLDLVVCLK